MEMRRKEREMSAKNTKDFLFKSKIGRLGTCYRDTPYVVPIHFVYNPEKDEIYLHSAKFGMKMDNIKLNPTVCFEVDERVSLIPAEVPCEYDAVFRSVVALGKADIIKDSDEKIEIMDKFMDKYAKDAPCDIPINKKMVDKVDVIAIKIISITGKQNTAEAPPRR